MLNFIKFLTPTNNVVIILLALVSVTSFPSSQNLTMTMVNNTSTQTTAATATATNENSIMKSNGSISKKESSSQDAEIKPMTGFAPPPMSAVLTILMFVSASLYNFPYATIFDSNNPENNPNVFTNRVFPELVSVPTLINIRLVFTLICFLGFISAWALPPVTIHVPYRPNSKCPRIPITLGGWGKQMPFTSWSWNVLGISFGLSACITYLVNSNTGTNEIYKWLVPLARIIWEIAAPMTLLIGAVVKYALWPAQLNKCREQNPTAKHHYHVMKSWRALLQHNANVIMAMVEISLLGGIPVRMNHLSIPILYGSSYVIFSWIIQLMWHRQGPAFIYFFMDTTIGKAHTLSLWVLLTILMIFYGLFVGIERMLDVIGASNDGISFEVLVHGSLALGISRFVCRFRD